MTARSRPLASTCRDHRTGAACTRLVGEDAGGGEMRAVVDDEGDVGKAAGLQAGGDPGGPETGGGGHAHGATPHAESPVVSGNPSIRFMHCTA